MKKRPAKKISLPKETTAPRERLPDLPQDGVTESPNRVYLPRKIGKHRPEEERGWKPTVI